MFGKKNKDEITVDQQLDAQLNPLPVEAKSEAGMEETITAEKEKEPEKVKETVCSDTPKEALKLHSIGDWMLILFVFLIPGINIIMMAVWAFSAKGDANRRNLSRASLLWVIILLIAYVVAMTVAGYTLLDIFKGVL